MLLLFAGVSMQAQSVASEQMDEQFSDGSEQPYGWFGEGWKMAKVDDDGVVQSEATENKGFDFGSMGMNPGQNPGQTPSMDALESVVFHGDIPMTTTTGIESYSIQTIDADGTSRYFDLQGRLLNDKPVKGLYIKDNKKVFDR